MMGMFDDIRFEVALPDGFTGGLQTKDFDCAMDTYTVRSDGTLAVARYDFEAVAAGDRPHSDPNDPLHFIGSTRRINERWEPVDFHGVIRCYGYEGKPREPSWRWHEYRAKFTDGRLVDIALSPADSGDR